MNLECMYMRWTHAHEEMHVGFFFIPYCSLLSHVNSLISLNTSVPKGTYRISALHRAVHHLTSSPRP